MGFGFSVEVWGDYACFSRPELKVERVSYEVITPSAARGILESILWKPAIEYVIDQISVCSPINFDNIRRNEIKSKITYRSIENAEKELNDRRLYLSASEERTQRASMVLRNVRYIISGHFILTDKAGSEDSEAKFAAMLKRRLENGQNYSMPYLGVREFPAFLKIINEGEESPKPIKETRSLGLMLYDIDYIKNTDKYGKEIITSFKPKYFMAEMINGIIDLRNVEILS